MSCAAARSTSAARCPALSSKGLHFRRPSDDLRRRHLVRCGPVPVGAWGSSACGPTTHRRRGGGPASSGSLTRSSPLPPHPPRLPPRSPPRPECRSPSCGPPASGAWAGSERRCAGPAWVRAPVVAVGQGLALQGWCTGTTWSNSQLPSSMGAEQSLQRKFCSSRMRSRVQALRLEEVLEGLGGGASKALAAVLEAELLHPALEELGVRGTA